MVKHASAFNQANALAWNPQTLFRCQGTAESILLSRGDVNMVCLRYAESKNHPFNGTRQTGDGCHQNTLRTHLGQRDDPFCPFQTMERDTAVPTTQTPNKDSLISPWLEGQDSYARDNNLLIKLSDDRMAWSCMDDLRGA